MTRTARIASTVVLFASLVAPFAEAEPSAWTLDPTAPARLTAPVPIELAGSRPETRIEIQDSVDHHPLAFCLDACEATIFPGRYRLFVAGTESTREGSRDIDLRLPSRILVTPKSRATHTAGLVMGITGPILAVVGAVVLLANLNSLDGSQGNSNFGTTEGRLTGFALMLGGITLTPIGWVMFGTTSRPSVSVTPLVP